MTLNSTASKFRSLILNGITLDSTAFMFGNLNTDHFS